MNRGRLFWGILVLLAGVLLLLDQLGMLPADFGSIFWPLVLIVLGISFFIGPALNRNAGRVEPLSIPLENAGLAEFKLNHGAGRLSLRATDMPGVLMEGRFGGEVSHNVQRSGEHVHLELRSDSVITPFSGHYERNWDMGVARGLPLKIHLQGGASNTELDLTDLQVTDLRIETGASSTVVRLPAAAGFTRVEAESGAASIVFHVPAGVAARIRTSGGLSSMNINTLRFPRIGDGYETPDYETAANRVDIQVESGVGSIEIK